MRLYKIDLAAVESVLRTPDIPAALEEDGKLHARKRIGERLFEVVYVVEQGSEVVVTIMAGRTPSGEGGASP